MPIEGAALQAMYGTMTEASLQANCERALDAAGWLYYHTHDSRRSERGFPDIVAVRGDRVIYRELKRIGGRLSPEQVKWRDRLVAAGQDWGLWTPYEWGRGEIMKEIE